MVYHKDLGGGDLHPAKAHTHPGEQITSPVGDSAKLEGKTKAEVQDHAPKAHTHLQVQITDIGGTYVKRIVGATPDFTETDFIADDTEHFLDLSGIIPEGTKAVIMNMYFDIGEYFFAIYSAVAGADMFNDGYLPCAQFTCAFWIFPVDENRRIAYILEPGGVPNLAHVNVNGYFK